jgi:hypothetical protein
MAVFLVSPFASSELDINMFSISACFAASESSRSLLSLAAENCDDREGAISMFSLFSGAAVSASCLFAVVSHTVEKPHDRSFPAPCYALPRRYLVRTTLIETAGRIHSPVCLSADSSTAVSLPVYLPHQYFFVLATATSSSRINPPTCPFVPRQTVSFPYLASLQHLPRYIHPSIDSFGRYLCFDHLLVLIDFDASTLLCHELVRWASSSKKLITREA